MWGMLVSYVGGLSYDPWEFWNTGRSPNNINSKRYVKQKGPKIDDTNIYHINFKNSDFEWRCFFRKKMCFPFSSIILLPTFHWKIFHLDQIHTFPCAPDPGRSVGQSSSGRWEEFGKLVSLKMDKMFIRGCKLYIRYTSIVCV